jgi:tetratricopeptide (TPR) repeat protein
MDADLREKALWKIVLYSKYVGDWASVSTYSAQFLRYKNHPEMARLNAMASTQGGSSGAEIRRLVQNGQKAEKEGKATEAMGYYEEALEIDPGEHRVRWNLVSVAMKANQYTRAVTHLEYLDRKDPQWKYTYKLGVCYYHLGRYQKALGSFDRATGQNGKPTRSFHYFVALGRGLTHLELEEMARAETLLEEAAKVKSSALLQGARARIALIKGNKTEAMRLANEGLKSDSEQLDALSVQALLTSNPDQYELFQEELFKNTVHQPPYYNAVLLQYAHVLAARSRLEKARSVLQLVDRGELNDIHSMKYSVAFHSDRALIFPGSKAELVASRKSQTEPAPTSPPGNGDRPAATDKPVAQVGPERPQPLAFKSDASRILYEEVWMLLNFGSHPDDADSIEKLQERIRARKEDQTDGRSAEQQTDQPATNAANESNNAGPSSKKESGVESDLHKAPGALLRQFPEELEAKARLGLLQHLIEIGSTDRAYQMAFFWNERSTEFREKAVGLSGVKKLIEQDEKWNSLYGSPESEQDSSGGDSSAEGASDSMGPDEPEGNN